jgi:hypothetical protein
MRHLPASYRSVLVLGAVLFAPVCRSQSGIPAEPLTGTASIPADADTRSIRFESLKPVRLPGTIRYTSDPAYCGRAFLEPGGSAFCPQISMEAPVTAIEVTYSYSGTPLASDEHGVRRLTFQVYFQPSALPAALLEALAGGKSARGEASRYFEVTTHREPASRYVLDERRSVLCEGTYLDGSWQPDDPDCDYTIRTNVVRGLSDFITVWVTPAASPHSAARTR